MMKRREFLKNGLGLAAAVAIAPSLLEAGIVPDGERVPLPLDRVSFNPDRYRNNDAQTIVVFLGGGMSDVVGNMKHIDEIRRKDLSYRSYPDEKQEFSSTPNGFWEEAGGSYIEKMLADGNANIFRTCYQIDRILAHGINQAHYMRGNKVGYKSGIVTTLMHVLNKNGVISEKAILPNVAIDGSDYRLLQDEGLSYTLPGFLQPASFNRDFDNPYEYLKDAGLVSVGNSAANEYLNGADFDTRLNDLAQRHNLYDGLSHVFNSRKTMSEFIEDVKNRELPVEYPGTVDGKKLETAMRILVSNPDTRIVSMLGGYSGWDDHSDALTNHRKRAYELFEAIYVAMEHAKAEGKENINIVLFGDFGRNMNLNGANGWDHGNNQVVYWFGGKRFFHQLGIVGNTELDILEKKSRLFSKPAADSYRFQAYSVASTIYALYGVENPEVLTGGEGIIDPVDFTGSSFLKV
jgi:hypothetical protein